MVGLLLIGNNKTFLIGVINPSQGSEENRKVLELVERS